MSSTRHALHAAFHESAATILVVGDPASSGAIRVRAAAQIQSKNVGVQTEDDAHGRDESTAEDVRTDHSGGR